MTRPQQARGLLPDRDQRLVSTPYGRGLVVRTHPETGMQDIQLLDWEKTTTTTSSSSSSHRQQQEQQSPHMLYSPLSYKSVAPMVGDDVLTVYGRGRVIGLKPPPSQIVIVELSSWRLAQRNTVKCFLDIHQVQVLRKKTLVEMNAWERVEYAQDLKTNATSYFQNRNYEQALVFYSKAVDAVRNVQHDVHSSNELRADLVLLMITCCNNAATCCIHLSKYTMAIQFAKNALVLIDALYEKRGMKIHSILVNEKWCSDRKLFGEYKVKSLLCMAQGFMEQGEYAHAMNLLKQAHQAIALYTKEEEKEDSSSTRNSSLLLQQKQVKRLHATCIQRKKALLAKEKQRAQAMFASPSNNNNNNNNNKSRTGSEKPKQVDRNTPIVTPSPKPSSSTSQATETETTDEGELEEISTQAVSETSTTTRSSSFDNANDDEKPWYEEHKEALVLSAVAGLAAFAVVLLRSHRK